MGVATGASLQSARFSVSHIPYGNYDLCVIANGINSHCISFCHCRPKLPCDCDHHRTTCGYEKCCNEACNEDVCYVKDWEIDPEITELQDEVKRLQRTFHRLSSRIKVEEPVREPKEITKESTEEKAQGNKEISRKGKT